MSLLIEEFKKKKDFYCENGASESKINEAEKALGIQFAEDYKEYLMNYGSVSCGGHELTGLSTDDNLDVISVTLQNRKKNPNINNLFYVVEETHIDGIVIWQNCTGEIFQSEYKEAPLKIFDSLLEYVSTFSNCEDEC